jgi:TusE/DsrC/DsvC family sulfur relay protein
MHGLAQLMDLETVARDEDGCLLDAGDWTPRLAAQLAVEEGLELTEERWHVVSYLRNHFDLERRIPERRLLLTHLRREWASRQVTPGYLYQLFPGGYAWQACKIAGMRWPLWPQESQ